MFKNMRSTKATELFKDPICQRNPGIVHYRKVNKGIFVLKENSFLKGKLKCFICIIEENVKKICQKINLARKRIYSLGINMHMHAGAIQIPPTHFSFLSNARGPCRVITILSLAK